jgi:hypothetical protein
MAIKKSDLYSSLWASCDELRGGMDASQYKDYVLFMLFIKYVSDKYGDSDDFAPPVTIPKGASFKDMIALKGKSDIGGKINTQVIQPLIDANSRLARTDFPDFNDPNKLGEGQAMVDCVTNLIGIFQKPELDFSKNRADHDDILGDAYEYLIRHFATESGKSKGQFYTPSGLTKATNESLNVTGGFLAPVDYDAAIIRVVETLGTFRQGAEIRPTGSDGQVRPRRAGGLIANFVPEGAPIPESNLLLDAVETAQKGLKILARGSTELLQDSAPVLAEFITKEMGYGFAGREDDAGFNGDGNFRLCGHQRARDEIDRPEIGSSRRDRAQHVHRHRYERYHKFDGRRARGGNTRRGLVHQRDRLRASNLQARGCKRRPRRYAETRRNDQH